MNRITPIFLFLSVALIIWGSSVATSNYLAGYYEREHKSKAKNSTTSGSATTDHSDHAHSASAALTALRAKAASEPKNLEAQLQLGYGIFSEAIKSSNGSMLMEAVKSFKQALDISPDNPDALLGLASLCLQAGITDKALEYYPRYLKQRPEDKRAKTDFALVHFKSGDFEKGQAVISEVLKEDPKFFTAYMVMAFAYRAKGDIAQAEAQAQLAKKNASEPNVKNEIEAFISSLKSGSTPKPLKLNQAINNSPKARVETYVKNHSILAPKYRGITWKSDSRAEVSLEDFPVEQMPPFAKQIFISKAQQTLKSLGRVVEIVFVDSESSKELLVIPVGGELK